MCAWTFTPCACTSLRCRSTAFHLCSCGAALLLDIEATPTKPQAPTLPGGSNQGFQFYGAALLLEYLGNTNQAAGPLATSLPGKLARCPSHSRRHPRGSRAHPGQSTHHALWRLWLRPRRAAKSFGRRSGRLSWPCPNLNLRSILYVKRSALDGRWKICSKWKQLVLMSCNT